METIEGVWNCELILPFCIGIKEFEEALAKDKEIFLQKTRQHLNSIINEDFHYYMSWWACP
jgi:hypothetical protein